MKVAVHVAHSEKDNAICTPTSTAQLDLSQTKSIIVTPDWINIEMQEPSLPPITQHEYDEARMESQNREFMADLERGNRRSAKMKQKLPHMFGNRKERRRLQAQIRKGTL